MASSSPRRMGLAAVIAATAATLAPAQEPPPGLDLRPDPLSLPTVDAAQDRAVARPQAEIDPVLFGAEPREPLELLSRTEPDYPPRAFERGIEGSCDMTFSVTASGDVDRETIVAECTSSIFARSAFRATAQWTYVPDIVDGQPAPREAVTARIEFSLPGEASVP